MNESADTRQPPATMLPTAFRPERLQGKAGHLTDAQKTAIRLTYLEESRKPGVKVTFTALAEQFNVNRDTISALCRGPEFQKLEREIDAEARQTAIQRMKGLTAKAVDAYETAIPIAAEKGDVRPAKDILKHQGIMESEDSVRSGVLVLTKIVFNGMPMMKGSDGELYEPDSDTGKIENLPKASVIMESGGLTLQDVLPATTSAIDGEIV